MASNFKVLKRQKISLLSKEYCLEFSTIKLNNSELRSTALHLTEIGKTVFYSGVINGQELTIKQIDQILFLLSNCTDILVYNKQTKGFTLKLFLANVELKRHTLSELTTLQSQNKHLQDRLSQINNQRKEEIKEFQKALSELTKRQEKEDESFGILKKKLTSELFNLNQQKQIVIYEKWDHTNKGNDIKLKNGNRSASFFGFVGTGNKGSYTVLGKTLMTAPNCYHIMIKAEKVGVSLLGVAPHNTCQEFASQCGYVISLRTAGKKNPNDQEFWNYGKKIQSNDIIQLKINLNDKTLSMKRNGDSYGIAFRDLPEKVKLIADIRKGKLTLI
ncbi:spry domain-containing socs box protein [Anaeramoeba flamelloides]|uniref:Spry domain-containing socs box protein n=1 Tax=Anaeramoeba flamelloides TaxID=1746091 RepID=A0ABQ8Y5Q9_9EUKA|nr:spry domain-containing socs box protein [Anaeramoeba flamelloides]